MKPKVDREAIFSVAVEKSGKILKRTQERTGFLISVCALQDFATFPNADQAASCQVIARPPLF